jgi:hypothetical protein
MHDPYVKAGLEKDKAAVLVAFGGLSKTASASPPRVGRRFCAT